MSRCINFVPRVLEYAALRVSLTSLDANSECFGQGPCGGTGDGHWWVTIPVCTDKAGTDTGAVPGVDSCDYPHVWRSQLSVDAADAYCGPWPDDCIFVCDCEVVPLGRYEMQCCDCITPPPLVDDCNVVDPPLARLTQIRPGVKCFGDAVGGWTGTQWTSPNQVVSMDDIMAAVFAFQNAPNAPHRCWVEMADEDPDMVLNFADIQKLVDGFKGNAYPYSCPEDCP